MGAVGVLGLGIERMVYGTAWVAADSIALVRSQEVFAVEYKGIQSAGHAALEAQGEDVGVMVVHVDALAGVWESLEGHVEASKNREGLAEA